MKQVRVEVPTEVPVETGKNQKFILKREKQKFLLKQVKNGSSC